MDEGSGKHTDVSRAKFWTFPLFVCPLLVEEIYYKWSVFGVVVVLDEEDFLCDEIRTEIDDVA